MENSYETQLHRNHKRNSFWNTVDASFYQIAFTCSIPGVIIVAFLKYYTDSQMVLNLPILITSLSHSLIPFLVSFLSGRLIRKKKAVLITGGVQRLIWIVVAVSVVFYADRPGILMPMFFTGFILYEILAGATFMFWSELMGRALEPSQRVSAMGTRESISRLVGFGASLAAAYVLSRYPFPGNYAILFFITFFANMGSTCCHGMIKEAAYDRVQKNDPKSHLKTLLRLPLHDRTFLWYSVFNLFASGQMFIGGLYTVLAIRRFEGVMGQDRLTGIITIITLLAGSFFSYVMGKYARRYGNYRSFLVIMVSLVISPLYAAFTANPYGYLLVFVFSSISVAYMIISFSTILDFGEPDTRHQYIAFNALIRIIPIVIFTNLGGYLTDRFSPQLTLVISAVFCLCALFVLVFKLGPLWAAPQTVSGLSVAE